MNALRTLPILHRPSRPASPAPPSTQTTTATAQPPSALGLGILQSVSEPGKPRSRSLSRQVTDKTATNGTSSPIGITGINGATMAPPAQNGKRASPPGSRAPTPRLNSTPIPTGGDGTATPQTGYMDVLGLRLNESVNKACLGVDFKAKKGFKQGSGWGVGEAVVKEMPTPQSDAYLLRAVLRTAVRSLSIYITRLESILLPAITDPTFIAPLNLSAAVSSHPLNPVQYFALSVAHTAWQTCETLEQTLETGTWPRFVSEALRPVMDKLDLVVGKVVQPLLLGLKRDLIAALSRTDGASPAGGKTIGLAHTPAPATATANGSIVPMTKENSSAPLSRLTKEPSGGGHSRVAQLPVPVCLQHFAARVDGARKVLDIIAHPCQDDGEGWVTGVVVAVIWKGMCVISEKDLGPSAPRPPSPGQVSKALNGLKLEKDLYAQNPTPSLGGVTAKLTTMLPSRTASRGPSPPRQSSRWDPMTHALLSLEGLVKRLVTGLVEPALAPAQLPGQVLEPEHIAREALFEALEALTSFRTVSSAINGSNASARLLASSRRIRDDIDDDDEEVLDDAMEDMPAVTILTVLLRRANCALSLLPVSEKGPSPIDLRIRSPAEVWGWTVVEYERQALSGFAAAEDWGKRVASTLKLEIERVMAVLATLTARSIEGGEKSAMKEVSEAVNWVKCLGVACEARGGVRVVAAT